VKRFLFLLGFFTRLPVPQQSYSEEAYARAVRLLPLVGLVIGAILALVSLIHLLVGGLVGALLLLIVYLLVTGGLHFDGLADSADGVFSGRSRERALEIMKDSRIGAFGVLALILAALAYLVLFTEVPWQALLIFPVVGRTAPLIAATLAPYARPEGMGATTAHSGGGGSVLTALLTVVLALLLPVLLQLGLLLVQGGEPLQLVLALPLLYAGVATVAALLSIVLMTHAFRRRLGGVTGDTFGAMIEISSVVFLFFWLLTERMVTLWL
jgi:adenosylcobinamide-GDP ribazoletransferase